MVNPILIRPSPSQISSRLTLSASLMHGINNAPYKVVFDGCHG
jgi:hypothetical protein